MDGARITSGAPSIAFALAGVLVPAFVLTVTLSLAPPPAHAQSSSPSAQSSGSLGRWNSARLELPRPVEDSIATAVTRGLGMLVQESHAGGPPSPHAAAYREIVKSLGWLMDAAGDSVMDNGSGQRYLTDHGLRVGFERPTMEPLPAAITIYNPFRLDETSAYLLYREAGKYVFQEIQASDSCCAHVQGLRTWREGGHQYAVGVVERVGVQPTDNTLVRFRQEDGRFVQLPADARVPFAPHSLLRLEPHDTDDGHPLVTSVEISASPIFALPDEERRIQWQRTFVVRPKAMQPESEVIGYTYYGVLGRALESLVARDHKSLRLFVNGEELAAALEELPWAKAQRGWVFESVSAEKDTLVCSHPAVGRLTLVTAEALRYQRVTDFGREPLGRK